MESGLGVLRNPCVAGMTVSSTVSLAVAGREDKVVLPVDVEVQGEET